MPGSASLPIVFGALLAGAVILDKGAKEVVKAFGGGTASASTGTGGGAGSPVGMLPSPAKGSNAHDLVPVKIGNFPTAVNPFPGASGSGGRLDQGIDVTGSVFQSPWAGKVVASLARDPGWDNGGYVAVQSHEDPSHVFYFAEGIAPSVRVGQDVNAGDIVGYPVSNPYNQIVGSIEAGLANPNAPRQPLAQVIAAPAKMVDDMYKWLTALGGAQVSSLSSAGHA